MALGAMQRIALEMCGVRYLQVEVGDGSLVEVHEYGGGDMRHKRDADLALPFALFESLLRGALDEHERGALPLSVDEALEEAAYLERSLERGWV